MDCLRMRLFCMFCMLHMFCVFYMKRSLTGTTSIGCEAATY